MLYACWRQRLPVQWANQVGDTLCVPYASTCLQLIDRQFALASSQNTQRCKVEPAPRRLQQGKTKFVSLDAHFEYTGAYILLVYT